MDGERFDALTKALSAPSRRKFLRLLTATFLTPAALQRHDLRAAASCTEGGGPCILSIECCSQKCENGECLLDPGQQCETAAQCGSGVCQVVGTTEVAVPGKKKRKKKKKGKGKGEKGKKKGRKTTQTVEVKACAA